MEFRKRFTSRSVINSNKGALLNSYRLTSSFVPCETLFIQRYGAGCSNRMCFVATLADRHFLRFGALRSDLAVDTNQNIQFYSRDVHVDCAALRQFCFRVFPTNARTRVPHSPRPGSCPTSQNAITNSDVGWDFVPGPNTADRARKGGGGLHLSSPFALPERR